MFFIKIADGWIRTRGLLMSEATNHCPFLLLFLFASPAQDVSQATSSHPTNRVGFGTSCLFNMLCSMSLGTGNFIDLRKI